jgi:hypothetical protein
MTNFTGQTKVIDQEGVFHLTYTGGTASPVIIYQKWSQTDTAICPSETLGIGKCPTIIVKHGAPKDTLVIAWLSLNADTIYCSVKKDSVWLGPYPLISNNPIYNTFSVPRMALGLHDSVYYTYTAKLSDPPQLRLMCGKFQISNLPPSTSDLLVSSWAHNPGSIDSLGAAIGTDYNGRPHLAWLQDTVLFYAVPHETTFRVVKLCSARSGLGEPMSLLCDPYTLNTSIVWPLGNNLMRSYFYVEDTSEIFKDTVHLGSDTIKQISTKEGFAAWKEANHLFLNLWDAVNRTWSTPQRLDTSNLEGFYTQTEASQFINSQNELIPTGLTIWTEKENDTLYRLAGVLKQYENNGEAGIMPAAYLRLGQCQSTPFTVFRNKILSFGSEEYKHVDIGYDSLVYHLPSVKPDEKGRIFIESYFDIGDTMQSYLYRLVVNDTVIRDSIAIHSGQLSRTTEFLPAGVMQAGQLTIKLFKLQGNYVPCSRIILTTFELDSTGSNGGGQQGSKIEALPGAFMLCQNAPNPFSKATAIRYALPMKTRVSLMIYDVTGRMVRKLVDGEQEPGYYTTNWDGKDNQDRELASGVYFYRFETKEYKSTKKVVQLK